MFHKKRNGSLPATTREFLSYFHIPSDKETDPIEDAANERDDDNFFSEEEDHSSITQKEEDDEEEEKEESKDENVPEKTTDYLSPNENCLLSKAKQVLKQQLSFTYGAKSVVTIMKAFNAYIDSINPFEDYQTDDQIGFSWSQIKDAFPNIAPIAIIAMKLHSAPCSEASCERTISSQKLILNARRRNSEKDLLNARLTLMRAQMKK